VTICHVTNSHSSTGKTWKPGGKSWFLRIYDGKSWKKWGNPAN